MCNLFVFFVKINYTREKKCEKGGFLMSLKIKSLSTTFIMLLILAFSVVGVLALPSAEVIMGGQLKFQAVAYANVYGQISGSVEAEASQSKTIDMQTLNFSGESKPSDEAIQSWETVSATFQDDATPISIIVTIENLATDRPLYASINPTTEATYQVVYEMDELDSSTSTEGEIYDGSAIVVPASTQDNLSKAYVKLTMNWATETAPTETWGFDIDLNSNNPDDTALPASSYPYLTFAYVNQANKTVSVTKNTSNLPTGRIVIPKKVIFNDQECTVTTLLDSAFIDCSEITMARVPGSVTTINPKAFQGCSNLLRIKLSDNVTTLATETFKGCTSLKRARLSQELPSISYGLFNNCTSLVDVNFPENITSIGGYAFGSCEGLKEVTIPDSVIKLEDRAFNKCTGLVSLIVGDNVKSIGTGLCNGATSLEKFGDSDTNPLDLPKDIEIIPDYLFLSCSKLGGEVVIPSAVKSIGLNAFGATKITRVTIPDSVENIVNNAFASCSSLEEIDFGDGVKTLGNNAFQFCSKLTSVALPSTLESIGTNCFLNCQKLQEVVIPDNVTNLGGSAFTGCTALASVKIGSGVQSIGYAVFSGCKALSSVTMSDATTSIGASSFSGCTSLTSITIPDNVETIGASAFNGCTSLTSITLPGKVNSIGASCFAGCTILTTVYIEATIVPTVAENSFLSNFFASNGTGTIYVPNSALSLYQADAIWVTYNIVGYDPQ